MYLGIEDPAIGRFDLRELKRPKRPAGWSNNLLSNLGGEEKSERATEKYFLQGDYGLELELIF